MEPAQLSSAEFEEFRRLIYKLSGIHVPENRITLLSNRIRRRIRALQLPGYSHYLSLLKTPAGSDEINFFLDAVTTNETSFFRTEKQFQWLQTEFLEDLCSRIQRGQHPRRLRIWSAACSTGQEPLTIGICLLEYSELLRGIEIEIDATDLSEHVLAQARSGLYERRMLAGIPLELQHKYFQPATNSADASTDPDSAKDLCEVRSPLRKLIRYQRHNLITRPPASGYDCIFLRNVMIYFDQQSKTVVAAHLQRALADGGYLVIGPSEGLHDHLQQLQRRSAFIYQKNPGARP
ncbi:MAG: CheR family methyltransferase [Planctomycetota bacterium]